MPAMDRALKAAVWCPLRRHKRAPLGLRLLAEPNQSLGSPTWGPLPASPSRGYGLRRLAQRAGATSHGPMEDPSPLLDRSNPHVLLCELRVLSQDLALECIALLTGHRRHVKGIIRGGDILHSLFRPAVDP